ncbi:MAG: hypothetical protein WCI04_00140 [archaeon]
MATKKKESEGVDIFGSAKPKGKSSSAKSDKTVVEVKGLEKKLLEHQWLSGEQANLKTQIDIVKDELKQIGLEKYVELYKENKSNPNTFLLQDGEGCVMFMPTDKYITIDEGRAEELIERYGEDAVTVDEKFSFDSKYLERNLEAIKKLLRETKTISDEDKKNLLVKEVKYSVSKGTIDKLYQYGSKMASVLDDVQPVIALKNCGGKMEKGGNMDDLIGYVYEGEDADEKIIKKVDLYAKGSTVPRFSGYSKYRVEGGDMDLSLRDKMSMYAWIDNFLEKYSGDDNRSQSLDMYKEFAKKFKKNEEQTHDIIDSGWARSRGYDKRENGGGVGELKVGDKVELRMGGDSKRGVVVSPPSNGKVSVEIEYTDVLSKRLTKMKTAFPVSSIHKLSTMAKGGGVKRKTAEEIYEEEQQNAMFNSEYGNGGNIGDFSENEILSIQQKVEKSGQKVVISKEEIYEDGEISYGIDFEEDAMWYGDDKELRDSDYDKLSQLLTFNSSKYSYGKYAKGGNMSSGYDYSIGGL